MPSMLTPVNAAVRKKLSRTALANILEKPKEEGVQSCSPELPSSLERINQWKVHARSAPRNFPRWSDL